MRQFLQYICLTCENSTLFFPDFRIFFHYKESKNWRKNLKKSYDWLQLVINDIHISQLLTHSGGTWQKFEILFFTSSNKGVVLRQKICNKKNICNTAKKYTKNIHLAEMTLHCHVRITHDNSLLDKINSSTWCKWKLLTTCWMRRTRMNGQKAKKLTTQKLLRTNIRVCTGHFQNGVLEAYEIQ